MSSERLREHPAQRFDAPSLNFDFHAEAQALRAEATTTKHGHRQKTLFKHAGRTIAIFVMDENATMRDHATDGTVTIQPVEGELVVTVDGEDKPLKTGHLLVIAPGIRHEVHAPKAAVFVLQISLGA
jgi:quercetin dioxygenase-like cupin family protein